MDSWEDLDVLAQADLLAYDQIRDYEEQEHRNNLYKMLGASRR